MLAKVIGKRDPMRTLLRRMGNSSGVIIPKPMLSELGAHAGDEVEMSLDAGKIII
jgi:antitoxin MazE